MTVGTADSGLRRAQFLLAGQGPLMWFAAIAVSVAAFALQPAWPWLRTLPPDYVLPISDGVNMATAWFVASFKIIFRAVNWLLDWPMAWLRDFLHWLPWPAALFATGAIAWKAGGVRLTMFAVAALFYMLIVGYWHESMNTLALVGVSVPLSVALGGALGIAGYKSRAFERVLLPTLDMMQTIPTFAYLIPILLLFGFGPVVGLIASMIYAAPPMTRNVMLGLQRVLPELTEAGRMAGCSPRQLLWRIQVPAALPTIMLGVNQTIMAALSMVIIAAVIGGFSDIGWEVLSTTRKADFGRSLLSGLVIAFMAILLDRISAGLAKRHAPELRETSLWQRFRLLWIMLVGVAALVVAAQVLPALHDFPDRLIFRIEAAAWLNDLVNSLVRILDPVTKWLRDTTLFYLLLPLSRGMIAVATPKIWGIELTPPLIAAYALLVAALAVSAARALRWPAGLAVICLGVVYYFGATNLPWLAVVVLVTTIGIRVGGWRVGLFALLALLFMLLSGVWRETMISLYLVAVTLLVCCVVGIPLGVWAALNDRVSARLRPVNDTLQTLPVFVFLIPGVMFFKVGDFPALIAMVSYAIVPVIRYTEHGIRGVRFDAVEAGRAMGCSRRQILFRVQLPQAMPEIMLGMNQTILFSLAMLVIAALVGTRELGQEVYNALTNADMGRGLIAGGSMALIAMVTDRIVQAWSAQRKAALGIAGT